MRTEPEVGATGGPELVHFAISGIWEELAEMTLQEILRERPWETEDAIRSIDACIETLRGEKRAAALRAKAANEEAYRVARERTREDGP